MELLRGVQGFLHGCDYNPDQWLDRPDILERDTALMQKAGINCVSLGIFSWALLEPEEGVYRFDWLDQVIDRLWKAGIRVILATPYGARPAWMAQRYPEVLRVDSRFRRQHFGERHNHCPSSPVYRARVQAIDSALAQRYAGHPAVFLWHLSNEFSGECWCPLCQENFRAWLKRRYGTLDRLNSRWWANFWSMRYTDWSQIEPPSPIGQQDNLSLQLDWRRFSTFQCKEFIRMEAAAVHSAQPALPVTANLMENFYDYDYFDLAEALDIVSWDSYPAWHTRDDSQVACGTAMQHDLMRSLKRQHFLLMESAPSQVNWHAVNKLKKPGVHLLSSLQALAHGSDSVQYFQWRKGRGGSEAFHGAVVSHDGRDDTRTFRQVAAVGEALRRLSPLLNAPDQLARVCMLYDWDARWALSFVQAGRRGDMDYTRAVQAHYRALWKRGIKVDFRDQRGLDDLSGYSLVIAPMLFLSKEGTAEKIRDFVSQGGCFLTTYASFVVGESNLAHLGDTPFGLTELLGLRAEELDALCDNERNSMVSDDGRSFPLQRLCELPVVSDAEVLARYGSDFYAGQPCLTRHRYGSGWGYYLAADAEEEGLDWLYGQLAQSLGLDCALPGLALPAGVTCQERGGAVFLQNYTAQGQQLALPFACRELLSGALLPAGPAELPAYGVWVLQQPEVGAWTK